jgi:PadR family transcriptional regulator, regulatory protein PadR
MPDQGRQKQGIQPRSAGTNGRIEVRPRNWLVPVILLTLRECTSYGYKLMEQTAAFGFVAMNPGSFYRTLRHMEKDGLCESEWDTTNNTEEEGFTQIMLSGRSNGCLSSTISNPVG